MTQSIKSWSKEDRPREKMIEKGPMALSESELITILLGSGSAAESADVLARKILTFGNNDLSVLARMPYSDLCKIKGIGPAKAVTLVAAFELGRRRRTNEVRQKKKIESSRDVFEYFIQSLGDLAHEEFWLMNLNRNNQVLSLRKISEGGWHSTIVDPKKVFARALEEKASAIIVAHNHPSGNLQPSQEDRKITQKLRRCGIDLELPVLDHLIIASHGYFSFADEGILDNT
ncbi:MAG: RadC family protein [Flavobacteriales bacterium]|jgi:DNA repair protein RadC